MSYSESIGSCQDDTGMDYEVNELEQLDLSRNHESVERDLNREPLNARSTFQA